MTTRKKDRSRLPKRFPAYLRDGDSSALARWLGRRLVELRANRPVEELAAKGHCEPNDLLRLEAGLLELKLGKLREVLECCYQTALTDLLEEYARTKSAQPDPSRPFQRDAFYCVRLRPFKKYPATPMFAAGALKQYLWATPLRRLRGKKVTIEFLELAPARKSEGYPSGETSENAHPGSEIIYVINGRVHQYINTTQRGWLERTLQKGDLIHFDSAQPHWVENADKSLPALLLVIRCPE